MRKLFIPIFWKFTIGIIIIVTIFGSLNLFISTNLLYKSLESEIQKRGILIAKSLATRAINPIMYKDIASLYSYIEDMKKLDSSIAYIFILDDNGQVLAHTFTKNLPYEILGANVLTKGEQEQIVIIQDIKNKKNIIRDIAIPILNGWLGTVRVGIYETNINKDIQRNRRTIIFMVLLFLILGIIAAFFFSIYITIPISNIAHISEKISIDSVNKDLLTNKSYDLYKIIQNKIGIRDEINILTEKFYEMLKRLENAYKELKLSHSSLVQSEKMSSLGTLTAGIIHEINNPIAGIQNCLYRISKAPENIKQNKEYIEMMDESIKKIKQVLNRLLNFSRKEELSLKEINIIDVIENSIKLVEYKLKKNNIKIIREYNQDKESIQGSPVHLEQVLINLLLNSIDAINEKRKKKKEYIGIITISLEKISENIFVSIEDNGTGIKQEYFDDIFNPFYTSKDINEGTGMGLSVCYNIVKEHNGEIYVESEYGKYAKFTVILSKINNENEAI